MPNHAPHLSLQLRSGFGSVFVAADKNRTGAEGTTDQPVLRCVAAKRVTSAPQLEQSTTWADNTTVRLDGTVSAVSAVDASFVA